MITSRTRAPSASVGDDVEAEDPRLKRADRDLLIACLLSGTCILVPLAVPYFIRFYRLSRAAEREGRLARPWSVTIAGGFALIDTSLTVLFWALFLHAHDTQLMTTLATGYGKLVDGGYYLDWNSRPLGATPDVSEWAVAAVWTYFVACPRMVACWYFLRMKRVGLQWMIITSYLTVALWGVLIIETLSNWDSRIGASEFGLWLWMVFNIPYMSAFLLLPFLMHLNRERFSD